LLYAGGSVVESQAQLERIVDNGFYQDHSWDLAPAASAASNPVKARAELPRPRPEKAAQMTAAQAAPKDTVVLMDDVHWFVGEPMTLQPHDKPTLRYAVQLIGFVKNRTVFVTAPTLDGKYELIRDGQTFVVRAFSGKKAFAFTAAALKSMHSPHPYLLLSYPKEVRSTQVRQSARVQVKIIASVTLGDPERTGAATIIDLSLGGASAVATDLLGKKGDEGRIKFKLTAADIDSYLNIKVVLRSVAAADNGNGFKHGFEFVDIPMHDRLVLSAYVHQTLAETD
jgi:c-di-GMP-binding flagellar brake protein YcgR